MTACGNNADDANVNNDNQNESKQEIEDVTNNEAENEPTEKEDTLSPEALFQKMNEANNSLESFSTETTIHQVMTIDGEEMSVNSVTSMDIIMDPLTMQQTIFTDVPDVGEQEVETYFTDEGFFMFDPEQDKWLKMPDELSGDLLKQLTEQANIDSQMQQFDAFIENFAVDEKDDHYLLTFKADDDSFNEQMMETLQGALPEEMGMMGEELFEQMTFNDMQYEMIIDKENYYIHTLQMTMDFDMELEGDTMHSVQSMKMTYDNYNNVGEIVVPDEILENAEEMEM